MGIEHTRRFWQERDEYHYLAELFDRNREYVYPDFITSDGQGCRWLYKDDWAVTCVKHEAYRGPPIHNV